MGYTGARAPNLYSAGSWKMSRSEQKICVVGVGSSRAMRRGG